MSNKEENIILRKSYDFAVRIVRLYQLIANEKKEFVLSKQILRSGTSVGANVEEAVGGVSKKDFKNKMGIAYKEARETHYWLRLLHDTGYIDQKIFDSTLKDCTEILKILYTIIKSSE